MLDFDTSCLSQRLHAVRWEPNWRNLRWKAIHSALLGASLIALSAPAALADPVQITNLGTIKIEVAKQFEAAMDDYNASQDKIFRQIDAA